MRKIDESIFQDEFILDLSHLERLTWIGLIVTCSDDQGRLENNPRRIRIQVFPDDDLPNNTIKKAISKFFEANKILIYQSGDKEIIQIKNWWKYQSGAAWMAKSDFPAPQGWEDFYRFHGKGGEIIKSPNWENRNKDLPSDYIEATLELGSQDININNDGNGKGDSISIKSDIPDRQKHTKKSPPSKVEPKGFKAIRKASQEMKAK